MASIPIHVINLPEEELMYKDTGVGKIDAHGEFVHAGVLTALL